MATKTISLELDAYEKLKSAKRSARESFSSVVRRARFEHETRTGAEVLRALEVLRDSRPECLLSDKALDEVEARSGSRSSRERAG